MNEINFFRCHLTEEAARALAQADVAAFSKAFPSAVLLSEEILLRERFADYGVIGCIMRVKVDVSPDEEAIATWLNVRKTGILLESEHVDG